jgi:hypothetical protein
MEVDASPEPDPTYTYTPGLKLSLPKDPTLILTLPLTEIRIAYTPLKPKPAEWKIISP